jgi:hypothetical protein
MALGSSRKIEPTIERQSKQQRKRQPRADLLISGHDLFLFEMSMPRARIAWGRAVSARRLIAFQCASCHYRAPEATRTQARANCNAYCYGDLFAQSSIIYFRLPSTLR